VDLLDPDAAAVVPEDSALASRGYPAAVEPMTLGYRRDGYLAVGGLHAHDPGSRESQRDSSEAFPFKIR
jgi:hypothetical protein